VKARSSGLLCVAIVALLHPARGAGAASERSLPVTARRAHVTVHAAEGLLDTATEIATLSVSALGAIEHDLPNLPTPAAIEIRLVKDVSGFPSVAPGGSAPPLWADGLAYPQKGIILLATSRRGQPIDLRGTLRHELAHLALGAAAGPRVPRWLHEGFAFLHSEDFSMARIQTLTNIAWSGRALPLSELGRHFPASKHGADRAYAQAYDFVAFLTRRGRYVDRADNGDRWAFRDFVKGIADGKTADASARIVYGAGLAALQTEWMTDLRSRYFSIPVGLFGAGLWVLAALLLIVAYIKKKLRGWRVMRVWEEEEAAERVSESHVRPQTPA